MLNDFCVFILTHGRPHSVHTFETLRRGGYTGRIYIVIDDEDRTADDYRRTFGPAVLQFSKRAVAAAIDEGDNFESRKAIIYARNVCFALAQQVGCRYFIELDDDYVGFMIRHSRNGPQYIRIRRGLDQLFGAMIDALGTLGAVTVCIAQGGDYFGGVTSNPPSMRRKAMNTFVCDVQRPFQFVGRINEDVNTYTSGGRRGELFGTFLHAMVVQQQTQSAAGGMTDLYLESGTYVKSFYSVMYCPSAVRVGLMGDPRGGQRRMHHQINWDRCAAKIIHERWSKRHGPTVEADA